MAVRFCFDILSQLSLLQIFWSTQTRKIPITQLLAWRWTHLRTLWRKALSCANFNICRPANNFCFCKGYFFHEGRRFSPQTNRFLCRTYIMFNCWRFISLIAHVRYIIIVTWVQGFLVIFLYLVGFYLLSILFWELRDIGVGKFAILTLKPRSRENFNISKVGKFQLQNDRCRILSDMDDLKLLYPVQSQPYQIIHWTNQRLQPIPVSGKKRGKTWECD